MLFKQRTLEKIARAEVTVAFRRWRRPTVRSGGRLRTPVGELAIDVVVATTLEQITEGQALAAGFSGREEAVRVLEAGDGELYRIEFRRLGQTHARRSRTTTISTTRRWRRSALRSSVSNAGASPTGPWRACD